MAVGSAPFATFLIVGPVCFFLGILFAAFPYDYNVLWTTPPALPSNPGIDPREPYFLILEQHLKFVHASPPLISRILHIAMGTGFLGFTLKLYKMSESNMLFDGASLVMYMIGVIVYITNVVKGMRIVTDGTYGADLDVSDPAHGDVVSREDSLRVLAATNTILALVCTGVLVLQAGQWYAQKKEDAYIAEIDQQDRLDKKRHPVEGKKTK